MTLHPSLDKLAAVFVASANGIVQDAGSAYALGAVLLLERPDGQIIFSRKAPAKTYEYGGRFVLPGGLVRAQPPGELSAAALDEAIESSLRKRVQAECGWSEGTTPLTPIAPAVPVVSSYRVQGVTKYTAVLAFSAGATAEVRPHSTDHTIEETRWETPTAIAPELAPANCVITAAYLWPRLTSDEKQAWLKPLTAAHTRCGGWAADVSLPPPLRWW